MFSKQVKQKSVKYQNSFKAIKLAADSATGQLCFLTLYLVGELSSRHTHCYLDISHLLVFALWRQTCDPNI